jgi:peptidyl-prolyl cis-trans isomerase C
MTRSHRILLCLALAAVLAPSAGFAADDPVLIKNSFAEVRRSDFDVEMQRVPVDLRDDFLTSRKRVGDLLLQILTRKSLAAQARAEKLEQRPDYAARLQVELERVMAAMRLAAVEEAAAREFDRKLEQHRARAREVYLADRDKYRSAEEVSASHILFDTKRHTPDEARKLAQAARARVAAGADFNAVAKEVSEDPSAATNSGTLGFFKREQMDAAFATAAFALKQPGALSEPVQSAFGWHVIRLDGRKPSAVRPFEEVRDEIVSELRTRYVGEQRDRVVGEVRGDPATTMDEPMLEGIVQKARHGPTGVPRAPAPASSAAAPGKP